MFPTPQFIHSLPISHAGENAQAHPLRIMGIYSDSPAHAIAMRMLHRLATDCAGHTRISTVWFSFDQLRSQTERDIAAARAAKADMLWYSGYSDQRPPASVRALIESWSQGYGGPERAIVALFQRAAEARAGATAAEEVLRDLVRRSRKPLFLHRVSRAESPAEESAASSAPARLAL